MQIPFEQVAIEVRRGELDAWIHTLKIAGYDEWVRDQVTAKHLFHANSQWRGTQFTVALAFNYKLLPHIEYELIALESGNSIQLTGMRSPYFCHIGYHVPDEKDVPHAMQTELDKWVRDGHQVIQVSQTKAHTGTKARYMYAFVDARSVYRTYVKIIQRLNPADASDRRIYL